MLIRLCKLIGSELFKLRFIKNLLYFFISFLFIIPNPSAYASFQCINIFKSRAQKQTEKPESIVDHLKEVSEKDREYIKSLLNINFDSIVERLSYKVGTVRSEIKGRDKELDALLAHIEVLREPEVADFILNLVADLIIRQNYNVDKLIFHKEFEVEIEKVFYEVVSQSLKLSKEIEKEFDIDKLRELIEHDQQGINIFKEIKTEIDEFLKYDKENFESLISQHKDIIEKELHNDSFTKNKIHWEYINPVFLYKFATTTMKNDVNQKSFQYKMLITNAVTTIMNTILAMKIAGVEVTAPLYLKTYLIFFLSYQSVEMVRNMITKATNLDARNRLFINWSLSMASYGFWSIFLDVVFKSVGSEPFNFDSAYYVYSAALLGYAAIWPLISQKVKEVFIYRVIQDGFPNVEDERILKSGASTEVILNNFRSKLSKIRADQVALDRLVGKRRKGGIYNQKDIRKKIHRHVRTMMSENASNWHMIDHISTLLRQVNYSHDKELQSLYQLEVERFKLDNEEHRYLNLTKKWATFFTEHNIDYLSKDQVDKAISKKYKVSFFLVNQAINSSMMGLYIVLKHLFVGESYFAQDGLIQNTIESTTGMDIEKKYENSNYGN